MSRKELRDAHTEHKAKKTKGSEKKFVKALEKRIKEKGKKL